LNGYLADTNIPSELGEMRKGVAALPQSRRRKDLDDWIETSMRPRFASNLLPITEEIAERWGLLAAEARSKGVGLSVADGLIAATALEHNLVLLTRNVKDFAVTGVSIRNPWED
jgi:predicted nucleic acid-binding protein